MTTAVVTTVTAAPDILESRSLTSPSIEDISSLELEYANSGNLRCLSPCAREVQIYNVDWFYKISNQNVLLDEAHR